MKQREHNIDKGSRKNDRSEESGSAGCYDVRSNTIFPIRRGSFRNEIKKGSRVQ